MTRLEMSTAAPLGPSLMTAPPLSRYAGVASVGAESEASEARPEPSIWIAICTASWPRPLSVKLATTRSGSLRARPAQGFSWTVVNGITFDVARFDQRMTWS